MRGVRKNEGGVFIYTYARIITTLIMFSQPLSVDFFPRTHARPHNNNSTAIAIK